MLNYLNLSKWTQRLLGKLSQLKRSYLDLNCHSFGFQNNSTSIKKSPKHNSSNPKQSLLHYFENLPPTLHPYILSDWGLQLAQRPSGSKSLKRFQRWDYQSRTMLCLDHHDNQNAANSGTIIFMLARSQLQPSSCYAFRCSSEAPTQRT